MNTKTFQKKAILVVNGNKPSKRLIKQLINKSYSKLIAVDGGANFLYEMKIIPDVIIGDLDSLSEASLEKIKAPTELIRIGRQSDTDVEKAIKYLIRQKYSHAIIVGIDGNRFDHQLGNLSIGLKYFERIIINIIEGDSILSFIGSPTKFSAIKGETISIFNFEKNTKISSEGLKYTLDGLSLRFGDLDSISNIATKEEIKLNIKSGKCIVVRSLKSFIDDNT
jgi:thiamine pyrophosphokinase